MCVNILPIHHSSEAPIISVQEAFDRQAAVYDQLLAGSQIRSSVWEIGDRLFTREMRLLDLGCGTGEDTHHFEQRGVNVTAVDISRAMIDQLKVKCGESVHCEVADMRTYAPRSILFDGVLSNFSALNYVPDLDWLARIPLAPGAHLLLTTLGCFYPLESARFVLKGRPQLALRRLRRPWDVQIEGVRFPIYYHSLRSIREALGQRFELRHVAGLHAFSPNPSLAHLRRYGVSRLLNRMDRSWCSHRTLVAFSDQFVSVWRFLGRASHE